MRIALGMILKMMLENNNDAVGSAAEFVELQEAERVLDQYLPEAFYDGLAIDIDDNNYKR